MTAMQINALPDGPCRAEGNCDGSHARTGWEDDE
jgi:hypothetical protein